MSKKSKSQNASQKPLEFKGEFMLFLGFSLKMTKFAFEFPTFLEAIRDFDFLLIAQVKLDILHVQNEVEQTLDS